LTTVSFQMNCGSNRCDNMFTLCLIFLGGLHVQARHRSSTSSNGCQGSRLGNQAGGEQEGSRCL
jgi:hypothetical protein